MFKWGLILQNIIKNVKKIKKKPINRDNYDKKKKISWIKKDKEAKLGAEEEVLGENSRK